MPSLRKSEGGNTSDIFPIFKGGTSIVSVKPVITNDAKCLLCGCGKKVRVYSLSSGEIIHDLSGHSDVVTGIVLNIENPLQALSCALDKCIIRWDYTDGVLLQKYELSLPLRCILHWKTDGAGYAALQPGKNTGCDVVTFTLPKHKSDKCNIYTNSVISEISPNNSLFAVGGRGDYIACSAEGNKLLIARWTKKKQTRTYTSKANLQSIACHPTEDCIATGDVDGAITLWYQFLGDERPVKTVVHWHSLPLLSLTFSREGSFLLSGGHECVLVNWQLTNLQKNFLPRVGSPICNIVSSKDGTLTVMSHLDNGIQVLSNSSKKVIKIFQGLTQIQFHDRLENRLPAGMAVDPRSSALVMNGRPGHIQFYSLHDDKQLYNLDIVGQNYVSPESLSNPLFMTEVENIAFSSDGLWMATMERRDDRETTPEIRLKFWLYAEKTHSYTLNTSVEFPHKEKIEALRFCPSSKDNLYMAVTTCRDGQFKLWTLVDDTDIYRTHQCWNCESVGFYKDLPAGPADFSQDGSLLAVGFGATLTLWDPSTNALRTHLNHPTSSAPWRHAVFGHGQNCHMLISANATTIVGWNLLSCSAKWIIPFSAETLVSDPRSCHLAAFDSVGKVCVFRANDGTRVFEKQLREQRILCAIFVPHKTTSETEITWQKKSQLYFVNNKQKLLTLGTKDDEEQSYVSAGVKLHQDLPQTAFSKLMAEKKTRGATSESLIRLEGHRGQAGANFMKELMGTPAHVLPPVTSLCLSFMDGLALKNKKKTSFKEDEDDDESVESGKSDTSDSEEEDEKDTKMDVDELKTTKEETGIKVDKRFDNIKRKAFTWFESL